MVLSHQDLNFPLIFSPLGWRHPPKTTRGHVKKRRTPPGDLACALALVTSLPARLLPVAVRCNCDCVGRTLHSRSHRAKSGDLHGGFREICPGQLRMRPLVLHRISTLAHAMLCDDPSRQASGVRHQAPRREADAVISRGAAAGRARAILQGDATFSACPCRRERASERACVDAGQQRRQLTAS